MNLLNELETTKNIVINGENIALAVDTFKSRNAREDFQTTSFPYMYGVSKYDVVFVIPKNIAHIECTIKGKRHVFSLETFSPAKFIEHGIANVIIAFQRMWNADNNVSKVTLKQSVSGDVKKFAKTLKALDIVEQFALNVDLGVFDVVTAITMLEANPNVSAEQIKRSFPSYVIPVDTNVGTVADTTLDSE